MRRRKEEGGRRKEEGGRRKEESFATKFLDFGPSLLASFADNFDTFLEEMLQLKRPHLHLILECSHLLSSLYVPRKHKRYYSSLSCAHISLFINKRQRDIQL
ncbi:unnamed protein product [Eruca vesicaria subsp. sativa]|uniref:Uncharacterized protein n=1 Tax=Eruca vesicaria subsp. sativa TaxID=29727 RepID=A0ABC8JVA4_ERUVS|nr:unnamed protein product [Eruca vesicaria subsp. sativa]